MWYFVSRKPSRPRPLVRSWTYPGTASTNLFTWSTRVGMRVGVPEDSYVPRKLLDTVTLELTRAGRHLGALTTLLRPDQEHEAHELAHEVVRQLEAGEVEPTHPGEFERLPWVA